jgi:hypothetical protein
MAKKYLLPILLAAFVCIGLPQALNGQSRDDQWNRLASISSGTRLVVDQDGTKALKGRFVRSTGQTLTLRTGGREIDLPRDAVSAVYRARRSSRLKRGLIGALAGAGAGLLFGAVAVAATKGDPLIGAGGVLIGIPAGAVIGAASGGGTKKGELIYSR